MQEGDSSSDDESIEAGFIKALVFFKVSKLIFALLHHLLTHLVTHRKRGCTRKLSPVRSPASNRQTSLRSSWKLSLWPPLRKVRLLKGSERGGASPCGLSSCSSGRI